MRIIKDQAVVLRSRNYLEKDKIVSLFTLRGGRLGAMAKGARQSRKRFQGGLEMGSQIEVVYEERPHAELVFLKEASIESILPAWKNSVPTIAMVGYCLELAGRFLPSSHPQPQKFELIGKFLGDLEEKGAAEKFLAFEFFWLALSGWEPQLERCGVCARSLEESKIWQLCFERGEMLCTKCQMGEHSLVSRDEILFLRSCREKIDYFRPHTYTTLQPIFDQYWHQALGKPLMAKKLLDRAILI